MVEQQRSEELLVYKDFRTKFETRYYSQQHKKQKEQEFLALQ
jgi:hypothetical protein